MRKRLGKSTRKLGRVREDVENQLKKAGISTRGITPHKLRHTAATLMYQYGEVDIRALQKVLRTCKYIYN